MNLSKRLLLAALLAALPTAAFACASPVVIKDGNGNAQNYDTVVDGSSNCGALVGIGDGGNLGNKATVDSNLDLHVANAPTARAYGGGTPVHYLSAASNNSTNVKGSAGTVYAVTAINTTTTIYYLKLYDKATAPTCGTDTPVQTLPVPSVASAAGVGGGLVLPLPTGMAFANGIGWCLVANLADNDNTNAATGVAVNFVYK